MIQNSIIMLTLTSGHEHSLQNCSGIGNLAVIIDMGTIVSTLTALLSFYCYVRTSIIFLSLQMVNQ